jgi:hypothetical protein
MKSLEEFQTEMLATMQRLGRSPSLAEVEAAGRELVADGIPPGANLEGLLLLRDLAEQREQETRANDNSG